MENRRSNSRPFHVPARQPSKGLVAILTTLVILVACAHETKAGAIVVPNFSFESQSAVGQPGNANPNVDSWQKIAEPAYFGPAFGTFGIPWTSTAGTFVDPVPANNYLNLNGNQGGYILAFPQVALFQDYNSSPGHGFDATFTVGNSYNLTIGINGSSSLTPGATLQLSLYYRDGSDNKITVGATTVTYSAATFPNTNPRSLIDFGVNLAAVQNGDAWAGQKIGIQLESTVPLGQAAFANWDFDNVRLSATPVPEPASVGLLILGFGGFLIARVRSRKG